jgi:hypothetical protein
LPYDFDLCGLVDASYAIVNSRLGIKSVKDRKYRGFKRDESLMEEIRDQILSNKSAFIKIVEAQKPQFELPTEYDSTMSYLQSFFDILEDEDQFDRQVIQNMRTR